MSVLEVMTEDAVLRSVAESFRVLSALRLELAYLGEMLDQAKIPRYSATDADGKAGPFSMAHRLGLLVAREQFRYDEAGSYKKENARLTTASEERYSMLAAAIYERDAAQAKARSFEQDCAETHNRLGIFGIPERHGSEKLTLLERLNLLRDEGVKLAQRCRAAEAKVLDLKQDPTEQEEIANLLDKAGIQATTPEGRRLALWERVSNALEQLASLGRQHAEAKTGFVTVRCPDCDYGTTEALIATLREQLADAKAALRDVKVSCTLPCSTCDTMREELAAAKTAPCGRCSPIYPGWVAADGLTQLPMSIVEKLREVQGDHNGAPGNVGWAQTRKGVYAIVSMKLLVAEDGDPDDYKDALEEEKRRRLTAEDQARAARRMVFDMQQEVERTRFELEELKKAGTP